MAERKLQDYKAVVFDMDGVIFDSERKVIECWEEIADEYGIPDIEEACYECIGVTSEACVEIMMKKYGPDFPYQKYRKLMFDLFFERYADGKLPMKPGVEDLLSALKKAGKHVALASSTNRELVTKELSAAGIIDYFDELVCGDMVGRSKPNPDIFLKACEVLGVDPKEAYAIEDSYNGIRAAYAGELHPIMVPDIKGPTEEMNEKAEIILESLNDVKTYLLA